ncbi:alpha/beta-hydrolase [Thozetella sp. PMI_491]|nr:alpha/beta-hydrolase [Thozetella sp. PMI_491]
MAQPTPLPRPAHPGFSDHKFTAAHGSELSIRVWPADPPVSTPAPFVSWTHGGGFLAGNHYAPLAWMEPGFRQRGYHLVSHNYRLNPQANTDDQLADCLAAIAWCRANLPSILGADKVDVDRYVICGESAGGHLVTLMAHYLSPPPRAVIDAYGIVDLPASWIFHGDGEPPNPEDAPAWEGEFSEAELEAFLEDRDPANVVTDSLFWTENKWYTEPVVSKAWLADFKYTRRIRLQGELHVWRSGLFKRAAGPRLVRKGTLHAERFADRAALEKYVRSISPATLLEGKTWYPPTAFLHGSGDEDVDLEQSQSMAKRLKDMGVPVVECYEEGEPHVFDNKYTSPDVEGWETYIQPILDFCNEHVGHLAK